MVAGTQKRKKFKVGKGTAVGIILSSLVIGGVVGGGVTRWYFKKEDDAQQNEARPEYSGSIDGVNLTYYQNKPENLGFGETRTNLLKAEAEGIKFRFYDFEDRRDINGIELDSNPLDAGVERVTLVMLDGKEYSYSQEKIKDDVSGEKNKLMLCKASEVYNYQLGKVREELRKQTLNALGPGPEIFKSLEKRIDYTPILPNNQIR